MLPDWHTIVFKNQVTIVFKNQVTIVFKNQVGSSWVKLQLHGSFMKSAVFHINGLNFLYARETLPKGKGVKVMYRYSYSDYQ